MGGGRRIHDVCSPFQVLREIAYIVFVGTRDWRGTRKKGNRVCFISIVVAVLFPPPISIELKFFVELQKYTERDCVHIGNRK